MNRAVSRSANAKATQLAATHARNASSKASAKPKATKMNTTVTAPKNSGNMHSFDRVRAAQKSCPKVQKSTTRVTPGMNSRSDTEYTKADSVDAPSDPVTSLVWTLQEEWNRVKSELGSQESKQAEERSEAEKLPEAAGWRSMGTIVDYILQPNDSLTFTLSDGRTLGYAVYGSNSPRAQVVAAFHGTPSSRLSYQMIDTWGRTNGMKFICPDRPGYGLSDPAPKHTMMKYAQDVQDLMNHLGHYRYKAVGISGGGPYALALTHLASRKEVTATVLIIPDIPPEAPHSGEHITWSWSDFTMRHFPKYSEEGLRAAQGPWYLEHNGYPVNSVLINIFRKSKQGRDWLQEREGRIPTAGHVLDNRLSSTSWGFDLKSVEANRIVIYAGGFDVNTPSSGAEYMRKRLQNCELQLYHQEDHHSLFQKKGWKIFDMLKKI